MSHTAIEVMQPERGVFAALIIDDEDVLGLDVAMEDNRALLSIVPDLVLQDCQRLARVEEEAPDVAFRHGLEILRRKVDLLPLPQIAKRIVLEEGSAVSHIWVYKGIVYGPHYPVASRNHENSPDLLRDFLANWHFEHFLDDLLLAVRDLRQDRNVTGDGSLLLPFTRVPNEDIVGGGGFEALATAASASSGCGGFAFRHTCACGL